MDKTFRTAASRLFWDNNAERWKAPFAADTSGRLERLLASLCQEDAEAFKGALFAYLHALKRTWL